MSQQRQDSPIVASSPGHLMARVVLPARASVPAGGDVVVDHKRTSCRDSQPYEEITGEDYFMLTVALRRGRTRVTRDGLLLHDGPVFSGMMRLSLPGERSESRVLTAMEAVSVSVPAGRVLLRARQGWPSAGARPVLPPSAQAEQLGRLLLHLTDMERPHAALFGDGIVDALIALMLAAQGRAPAADRSKGCFGSNELQRILDFADGHIGAVLGLDDWSAAFGMTAQDFARRFRLTTGSAPYAYFLRRRIERSKELMMASDAPLVAIALDVGFCSQSHFTQAFRRSVGIAPGLWRRSRGQGAG